jgi:hypothetical protein
MTGTIGTYGCRAAGAPGQPAAEAHVRSIGDIVMWPFKKKSKKLPGKYPSHHYVFAHVALRQLVFVDAYRFFEAIASPQQQNFLEGLWKQVCQNCDEHGPASFTNRDIGIDITRIHDFPAILVQMPEPNFIGEAHMVCIVVKVSVDDMERKPDNPEVRYFTLEKGVTFGSNAERTVICEWNGALHKNYGDGPEATPESFIAKIEEMI